MEDLAEMKEDAESRRAKVAKAAKSVAEKAEETNEEAIAGKAEETNEEAIAGKAKETDEEAAGKAKETDEEAEEAKDQEERRRLKTEFDIYTQSLWPVITCDMTEDPRLVEKALPSQELERQFSMLREITLKPISSLPDGYGLRVRELKERVEGSVIEADESLSVLKEDMSKAAQNFNDKQAELKDYVKLLEEELKKKVEQKQAAIKEAELEIRGCEDVGGDGGECQVGIRAFFFFVNEHRYMPRGDERCVSRVEKVVRTTRRERGETAQDGF